MLRMMTAAALATTLPLTANAQEVASMVAAPVSGTILDVEAEGEVARTPDIAIIRAGVVTQSATAAQALSENARQMQKVLAALKSAGVAPRDIQTASISLSPQYRYAENTPPVITGYQANNTLSVRFRDLAKSGTILDTLVAQGANQIDGPSLTINDLETAHDEARVEALKRAQKRADLYARSLGLKVERIISVDEGSGGSGPGIVLMERASAAAKDSTEIIAGEQQVSVRLRVRFLLK